MDNIVSKLNTDVDVFIIRRCFQTSHIHSIIITIAAVKRKQKHDYLYLLYGSRTDTCKYVIYLCTNT